MQRNRTSSIPLASGGVLLTLLVWLTSRSRELQAENAALAQRRREADRANTAKSRFLANMSHELRTPLNAIIGFTDLMCAEKRADLPEEHREFLADIRSSAHHLLHLINDSLDLARVEAGRISLEPRAIRPSLVAEECVDALLPLASEHGIELQLDGDAAVAVMLDPARLRQVILNYLSNAIKFTPEGGTVAVRVRHDRDELIIEVSDTGIGIAQSDQDRVFEEFEQIGSGRAAGGTGLGLAVTKRIVESQGGRVGVRSELGRGSTFYARIPASLTAIEQAAAVDSELPVPVEVGER